MRSVRVALACLGTAAMAYAVWSALRSPDIVPSHNGRFLLLVLVLHDGLLVPVFLLAGALVRRFVPPAVRAIAQAALIASASVTLVALPMVLGYGRSPGNPTALPLDYPRGLAWILAVIWTAAVAGMAVRLTTMRRRVHPASPAVPSCTCGAPEHGA